MAGNTGSPEILLIQTPHWILAIWTNDITKQQTRLTQTLKQRGKSLPEPVLMFSRPILIDEVSELAVDYCPFPKSCRELCLSQPLFFENTDYEFDFIFTDLADCDGQNTPQIFHDLAKINQAFHYNARRGQPNLRGVIRFDNHVGWFKLPLRYYLKKDGKAQVQDLTLSFEVWPTKMDMTTDLNRIYLAIDQLYPLWRFALAEKTEQVLQRESVEHQPLGLLWLAQFESLRDSLEKAIKLIINAPHSRLLSVSRMVKAEQFKAQISAKQAEQIRTNQLNGDYHKRYPMRQKILSVDTPENRFIKMVLTTTVDKLAKFIKAVRHYDQSFTPPRLSQVFFDKLEQWQRPLERYRNHSLFKEVGRFSPLSKESLVLQQKAGYAQVYRIWQMLPQYLTILGSGASVSMKPISDLYEVWCFLAIKQMLVELGFVEVKPPISRLNGRKLELRSLTGFCGTFTLKRNDGIVIELAHRVRFNQSTHPVYSQTTTQIPDILLKARFADGDVVCFIFDAKYRIDPGPKADGKDRVPEDAINQMHRFRDALVDEDKKNLRVTKSRAIFGAFALYPGMFSSQHGRNSHENPHYTGNNGAGIGAFPCLPGPQMGEQRATDNGWLRKFLNDKFGGFIAQFSDTPASADHHFTQSSVRRTTRGLKPTRYSDLCLIASGPEDSRLTGYYQQFENGNAKWFHMKLLATERDAIEQQMVMEEVRFCAVASTLPDGGERKARWLWPVRSVALKTRSELTLAQTGKPGESDEQYWLFELEKPTKLAHVIEGFGDGHHHIKLTKKDDLANISHFNDVIGRYSGFV